MLVLIVILLLIILLILWYLFIRNVDVETETFPASDQQVTIQFGHKYLQAEKNKPLRLGKNITKSRFILVDNPDYPEGVQLESVEYPGYYITYYNRNWYLHSKFYLKEPKRTIFIPIGIKGRQHSYVLVNLTGQTAITNHHNRLTGYPFKIKGHQQPVKQQICKIFHI